MMRESEEQDLLDEPRFYQETGVEAQIATLIAPVIKTLGFRLVRLKTSKQNDLTLQIMMERANGSMSIDDCELLSRTISPILDVEDVIASHYHLEISSPGIDRPMVRRSDFERWQGQLIRLQTLRPIEGQRRFRGIIGTVGEKDFELITQGEGSFVIAFDMMCEARLVITDELVRAALAKDKLRDERGEEKN